MQKIMERQDTLEDRLFISEVASEKYDKEKSNYINQANLPTEMGLPTVAEVKDVKIRKGGTFV